ncbi:MAG: GTPase Era [Clostridia bacterium]|nr:GTPase Era [Clostridia bacterium]
MEKFKSGFVCILGRTNVGKSTLLNSLIGEKIAIMANKPQTTRTQIKGIVNREKSQIVFLDTPGIHKPKTKLNNIMVKTAFDSAKDVDIILFIIEATSKEIGRGDSLILEKIKESRKKTILVINKIDLVKKEALLELIEMYSKEYNFEAVVPMSAINTDKNEVLLQEIEKALDYGPKYYDSETYTDQTIKIIVEEIIREKALKLLDDEVPHGVYVEVQKLKKGKTMENEPIFNIEATIYCERESHKGIIIGKKGSKLKQIGIYAREDIEKILGEKVNLQTWVKVRKDWKDEESIVKKFKIDN